MSELTLEVAISFCSEMAKKEVYEKVKKGNKMAEYGYVDVDKLCEFANNSTVGLTANDIMRFPRADVQPVNQWISVKDRLPETGESVLVYVAINKNLKGFGECKPEIRIGWLDDGDKWALQFSNMDYSEVLYWLPLPELPKDGDTNG